MNTEEPKRFWSKVEVGEPGECWEWLATKSPNYGQFWVHGKHRYAHRVAWFLTYGPVPKGLCVCHHCDNPLCCNPYHLFLGSRADNMEDAGRKGRLGQKLTSEDVREIRRLLKQGELTQTGIGELFGVAPSTISNIKAGRGRRYE